MVTEPGIAGAYLKFLRLQNLKPSDLKVMEIQAYLGSPQSLLVE